MKQHEGGCADSGFAMAALLVAMSIMAVVMSMVLPAWRTMMQREKEAELVFRGNQYTFAIATYQKKRGTYPPSIDVLVNEKFLRKKFKDPITGDDFEVVRLGGPQPGQPDVRQPGAAAVTRQTSTSVGGGPVLGVVSKSTATTFKTINGKNKYNEITFVATDVATAAGTGGRGTQQPGGRGGTNQPGVGQGGRGNPLPGLGQGSGFGSGAGAGPGAGMPLGGAGGGQRLQLPGLGGRSGRQGP